MKLAKPILNSPILTWSPSNANLKLTQNIFSESKYFWRSVWQIQNQAHETTILPDGQKPGYGRFYINIYLISTQFTHIPDSFFVTYSLVGVLELIQLSAVNVGENFAISGMRFQLTRAKYQKKKKTIQNKK